MSTSLPTGIVTFLFTDIEGSTKIVQEHPEKWETLRARHDAILREGIEANGGYIFQVIGDAVCAAFDKTGGAFKAALQAQSALQREPWGNVSIRVRMGLHTGEAEIDGGEYRGYLTMCTSQRVVSAGHGGQILLSQTTENLLRGQLPETVKLRDMGEHKLKDVPLPTRIFQVIAPELPAEFPALRTLSVFPSNLPAQVTSFVGREKEFAEVKRLLIDAHLLTLIGPGGTGKTRLSIQVAGDVLGEYPDGVWLVELAPIRDPLLVPRATAMAIGLRDESQRPVIDMLCDYLNNRKMLILLDNCEHLVNICAHIADRILKAAPNVRILASSRESLGIPGEVTYRVPSLGLPSMSHLPPIDSLTQYEAVRLFIDRAASAIPSFTVTNDNAAFLAQICHRLDGIPLAIELAAAKIRVLSVEEIARRLDDRFRLLTGGSRTALERHQTLRAAMDWSHNLLPPVEQVLYRRLSVFVGGWTLEAAESICEGESTLGLVRSEDILDLLEHLINKSLVIREEAPLGSRYRMLETMRQYANEKLVESGESNRTRDNHLEYFLDQAEAAEPHLRREEQIEWLSRLDADHENLRAALAWAMDKPSAESSLRLAGALALFWNMRAYWTEGAKRLDKVLKRKWDKDSIPQQQARAKVLYRRADFAQELDELDLVKLSAESALALCTAAGDRWGSAYSRAMITAHRMRMANFEECERLLEQSQAEFHGLGDNWGESFVLGLLARLYKGVEGRQKEHVETGQHRIALARKSGDRIALAYALLSQANMLARQDEFDRAELGLQEADQLFREIDSSPGINQVRFSRAQVYFARGEYEKAKAEWELHVDWCARVGEKNMQATSVFSLGCIAELENNPEAAAEYYGKSLELSREVGSPDRLAHELANWGRFRFQQGGSESAIPFAKDSLDLVKGGRTEQNTTAFVLVQMGGICLERRTNIAVQLLGASAAIRQGIPMARNPVFDTPCFNRFLAASHGKLSEPEFASAWEAGLKMTVEEAIAMAWKTVDDL